MRGNYRLAKEGFVAKRRLNNQQKARIHHKQAAMNTQTQPSTASTQNDDEFGPEQTGLIISHFRAKADVECPHTGEVIRCHLRANLPAIVTGDKVIWRRGLGEQLGTIQATGLQNAFQQAQQQASQDAQLRAQYGIAGTQLGEQSRQFGAGLGMQGLQQQLAAAGQLGQLGQQQYQQQGI